MAISQDDARAIYKPKNSREEFFVFVDPDQVLKWRKDKSIPMTDVVQAFDVFETVNGGNEGIAGRPSKQRLENAFDTTDITRVIEVILEDGTIHNSRKGHGTKTHRHAINETRGKGISTSDSAAGTGIHN